MRFLCTGFDIHGLDQNAKEDKEGIEKSSKLCKRFFSFIEFVLRFSSVVNDLVEEEIKNGIPSERVVRKSHSKISKSSFFTLYR
jgi:hypothetical protein